jgi:hypothetical protein
MGISVPEDREIWWSRHWFKIGLVVILFFSASIRLYQIGGFSGEYDEGAHLMVAWLLSEGYSLYTEVGTNQLPFLYQPTAWIFAVGEPSSVLARWLEVSYALLGIVAVAGIGRLLWRPSIGLVAALLLSLEIYYFRGSRIFGGSVASVAVGGLAVLFALYYQRTGHRKWLVIAGVVFSFSMLIKPLSLFTGILLLWAIIARRWQETSDITTGYGSRLRSFPWRGVFADCLYLGIAVLVLPFLSLIFYNGGAIFDRMIDCRLATKVGTSRGTSYLVRILTAYVGANRPLLLLAALGTVAVIWRRHGYGMWAIAWLGLNLALIVVWRAHSHHLVILDFPLVLLAAYPLGELGNYRSVRRLEFKQWINVIAILCMGYWLVSQILSWPSYFSAAPRGLDRPDDSGRWAAVRFLRQVSTPEQFIVSDDLSIPFEARRMVIPQLADVSSESIGCGLLTQEMVMQLANVDGSVFIYWTDRFLDEFPILPFWISDAYAGRKQFGSEQIIYYDKQVPQIAHPLSVTFGGVIALEGYEFSPDQPSQVTLFWRRLSAEAMDYSITLRLLDAEGRVAVQHDDRPYRGFYPTNAWPVGVLLKESVALPSFDALPPGEYSVVVGLYAFDTLELLPVEGTAKRNHNLALLDVLRLERQ